MAREPLKVFDSLSRGSLEESKTKYELKSLMCRKNIYLADIRHVSFTFQFTSF